MLSPHTPPLPGPGFHRHSIDKATTPHAPHRCSLASLLTIALHGKLEYYTSIMKELLVDLIDASAAKNPKLMLRRTESVVEKMLTNWMSICMYSCLRVRGRLPASPPYTAPCSSFRQLLQERYPVRCADREGLGGGRGQAQRVHYTEGDGGSAEAWLPARLRALVRELVLSHPTLSAPGALPALGEGDVETN